MRGAARSRRSALPLLFLALGAGGAAAGSRAPLEVPCAKMGGPVRFDVASEGGAILFGVAYPRKVGSYLGGFVNGTKDTGADVKLCLAGC